MTRQSIPTAFVLSGGASLGAMQAGMLEALYERGITADLIVGTSAGAMNGAFIASRPQTAATAQALGRVWCKLSRSQVFPLNPFTGALGFLGASDHLVPGSGLRRLIGKHATVERLEDTAVPLHVIATDVLSGEEVRLSTGPLVDAVMASAAIPGVLPTVEWSGRHLMDGGVSNNVPLSHARELSAKRIYVLPTGAPCELKQPPKGALAMVLYATGLLISRRLQAELAAAAGEAELIVLPPPCPLPVQPTDFSRADALIRQARREARRYLAERDSRPARQGHPDASKRSRRPGGSSADRHDPAAIGHSAGVRAGGRRRRSDSQRLLAWRVRRLTAAGFSGDQARELASASDVDLHLLLELIDRGCPPTLAARITAPLDPPSRSSR